MGKKLIYLVLTLILCNGVLATNPPENEKLKLSADFVTRHFWRGNMSGSKPCIQPTVTYSNKNFSACLWGSYTFDRSYEEIDLILGYKLGKYFQLGVADYFEYDGNDELNPFDYKKSTTPHWIDANIKFKGTKAFPISIMFSSIVYGYRVPNGESNAGESKLSNYVELGYATKIGSKGVKFEFGFAPNGDSYTRVVREGKKYENNKFAVVNLGLKITDKIEFKNYKLPIKASVICNPYKETINFAFGFTLR